jgi:hypothetical protein
MPNQLTKEKNNNQHSSWSPSDHLEVCSNICQAALVLSNTVERHRYRFTLEEIQKFSVSDDSRRPSSIDVIDIQKPVKRHRYRFTLSEIESFAPELNI